MRAFFLALAAIACIATACPAQSARAGSDPAAPVKKFYDWYYALPGDWSTKLTEVQTVFDPALFSMIQRGVEAGPDVIDFDPFINSQDGSKGYALGSPAASGTDYKVPLVIMPDRGTFRGKLTVVVRKSAAGDYVIYNFAYPGYDLRSYLQKALK